MKRVLAVVAAAMTSGCATMGSAPSILVRDREPPTPQELPKPAVIIPLACVQGPAEPIPLPPLPPSPGEMPVIPSEAPSATIAGLSTRLTQVQTALAVTQWRLSALEITVPGLRAQLEANEQRLLECSTGLGEQNAVTSK